MGRKAKVSNRTWEIRPSGIIRVGNVAVVEMRSQPAIERAGLVTLHLQLALPEFYPYYMHAGY